MGLIRASKEGTFGGTKHMTLLTVNHTKLIFRNIGRFIQTWKWLRPQSQFEAI